MTQIFGPSGIFNEESRELSRRLDVTRGGTGKVDRFGQPLPEKPQTARQLAEETQELRGRLDIVRGGTGRRPTIGETIRGGGGLKNLGGTGGGQGSIFKRNLGGTQR